MVVMAGLEKSPRAGKILVPISAGSGHLVNAKVEDDYGTKSAKNRYYPAYYQVPTNFMQATRAYSPRPLQFALRLGF
jgi:hypothetical protein